jgi:hypothetical protein
MRKVSKEASYFLRCFQVAFCILQETEACRVNRTFLSYASKDVLKRAALGDMVKDVARCYERNAKIVRELYDVFTVPSGKVAIVPGEGDRNEAWIGAAIFNECAEIKKRYVPGLCMRPLWKRRAERNGEVVMQREKIFE